MLRIDHPGSFSFRVAGVLSAVALVSGAASAQLAGAHDPAPMPSLAPVGLSGAGTGQTTGAHVPAPGLGLAPVVLPGMGSGQTTGSHLPVPGQGFAPTPFCFGDGSAGACPCENYGLPGHGCDNSAWTGGALLGMSGIAFLKNDSVRLTATGELPTSLSIVFQGDAAVRPAQFGDGLRCVGGSLQRLYVHNAIGGVISVPGRGDLAVSTRSAWLGDVIQPGEARYYQIYYRDPAPRFCPEPTGDTFNVSNALQVVWSG